ncbi:MAG TPA: hypothetical protein VGN72_22115 [Tepidisphaeraceae bacterium]|jgi:hypothetical protein|nr:hypothetical protein [Tepidisphaeraceae bacterium]
MQMTLIFPQRDGDLLAALKSYSGKINASTGTYEVTMVEATELATRVASFESALLACDPANRSKSLVITKNEARTAAKTFAYALGMAIAGRENVSLALKSDLGIYPRKSPTRHGPPTTRPAVDFVSVANRTVIVKIHHGSTTVEERKGISSAFVYTFVGEDYPTDPSLWQFAGPATRPQFRIDFPETVAGGTKVYVCAAWCNHRGETGPVSVPIGTNIQGGGVGAASLKIAA